MNILSKKFLFFIIVIEIIVSTTFGMYIYTEETNNIKSKFEKDVDDKISTLKMEFLLNFEMLYSLKGLFDNSELVTYQEFKTFVSQILKRDSSFEALAWIPKIDNNNKVFYESLIKKPFPNFKLKQKDNSGKLVSKQEADFYYPILYIEPFLNNEKYLGFDLSADQEKYKTLIQAAKSDKILSTPLINLMKNDSKEVGFFTLLPIYEKNSIKNIMGFVVALFKTDILIKNGLHRTHTEEINFKIYDVTEKEELIYHTNKDNLSTKNIFTYEKTIDNLDGRKWKIVTNPTYKYIDSRRTILPSMIILISIAFILFTTFYINLIIQRNKQIEEKVKQRTKELNEVNKKLKEISRTDSLTNIPNRRYFNEVIQTEWYRAIREDKDISIMIIDVDYFKLYNDKYGHIKGDVCLKEVALCLKRSLNRSSDFLARYGGEEFVIILPNTNDASKVAKRCKENIESLKILHEDSKVSKSVTISIGISSIKPNKNISLTNFLNKADQALYIAKANGRNTISVV